MFVASADVAQSVEHLIGNEEVGSSNLLISSKKQMHPMRGAFAFWLYGQIKRLTLGFYRSVMGAEPSAACGGYSEAEAQ